nr:unknown [Zea mays]
MEEAVVNGNFHEITEKVSVLSEMVESSTIIGPVREESLRLLKNFQDQLDSWERFVATQMDLTSEYNWDFDHYLEEDIPAALEYIKQHSRAKDGKLLAIGHSMGGILLYAMLSRSGFEGVSSNLAAIVTLASSVDYTTSNSSLKLLLPLANVFVIRLILHKLLMSLLFHWVHCWQRRIRGHLVHHIFFPGLILKYQLRT